MFGVKPITCKEISMTTVQSKYKELKANRKYIKERPVRSATKIQKTFRGMLSREKGKKPAEVAVAAEATAIPVVAPAPAPQKEFKPVALPVAPPTIPNPQVAPPKDAGGGAKERAVSPPPGASPLKAKGGATRAGSVPGTSRAKTPIRAKTPTQEVIAQLPTVVASRQDLEEMIKDFEDVVKGRELTDKLTQTEIEKLKKYNIYYNKGQIDGRSTIKSVELKLRMARLEIKEKALVPAKPKEAAGGAGAEKLPS
jgi:hypothetical protein